MARPSPATTQLVIRHDLKGRMSFYWKGERLPFVTAITVSAEPRVSAEVTVHFHGGGVRFETDEEETD